MIGTPSWINTLFARPAICRSSGGSKGGEKTPEKTPAGLGKAPSGTLVIGAEQEPACADWIDLCASSLWGAQTIQYQTMPRVFDSQEDVIDGIENTPKALIGLLAGENRGKRMVRVKTEVYQHVVPAKAGTHTPRRLLLTGGI